MKGLVTDTPSTQEAGAQKSQTLPTSAMNETRLVLRQLLLKALKERLCNETDYGPALDAARLVTPLKLWEARDHLQEGFITVRDGGGIAALQVMAEELTGVLQLGSCLRQRLIIADYMQG